MKALPTILVRRIAQIYKKAADVFKLGKKERYKTNSDKTNLDQPFTTTQRQEPLRECDTDITAGDFYSLISSLVDFVDELKLSVGEKEKHQSTEQIRQMLIDKLELAEVQLIRQDTWDSTKQRAVKVAKENGLGIKVLTSNRTGIFHRGKIIRKEEVVITK